MPISHVCPGCALELARVRACPDPWYGLPLVICPRCKHATTRRLDPMLRAYRRSLRLAYAFVSLVALGISLIFLLFLVGMEAMYIARFSGPEYTEYDKYAEPGFAGVLAGIAAGVAGLVSAAWLEHLEKQRLILIWTVLLVVSTSLDHVFAGVQRALGHAVEYNPWEIGTGLAVRCLVVAGAIIIFALATIPGRLLGRVVSASERFFFTWKLRRARARRRNA